MKYYFVYLLECADNSLYCGYTDDLEKRVVCHNAKKGAKYTKSRLPVSLVYAEKFANKPDALKREYSIKQMSRTQKLAMISCAAHKVPSLL